MFSKETQNIRGFSHIKYLDKYIMTTICNVGFYLWLYCSIHFFPQDPSIFIYVIMFFAYLKTYFCVVRTKPSHVLQVSKYLTFFSSCLFNFTSCMLV